MLIEKRVNSKLHRRSGDNRSIDSQYDYCVTAGFSKRLELNGVGYRMALQGQKLVFALGFSHPVEVALPAGISAKSKTMCAGDFRGIDKQAVGQFAVEIKKLGSRLEPYKGKGFRYVGELVLKRKARNQPLNHERI